MTGNFVLDIIIIVVGIPVIGGLASDVAKRWIAMREKELELRAQNGPSQGEYARIVERLEERLHVLERIATDPSVNVAAQIEALRDDVDGELETLKRKSAETRAARARDEEFN